MDYRSIPVMILWFFRELVKNNRQTLDIKKLYKTVSVRLKRKLFLTREIIYLATTCPPAGAAQRRKDRKDFSRRGAEK